MSTSFANFRPFQMAFQAAVLYLISSAALLPLGAIAQNASTQKPSAQTQPIATPQDQALEPTKPNSLEISVFSVSGGKRLVSESMTAISQQNYDQAVTKLQDARQVFNQLSSFYQELTTVFSGIDNRISDKHRLKALQTAQLRDEATYELAVVYRAKNQPELSVPLLIQLIRSQSPTRDLGQQAYRQLFELGFVDIAFVRPNAPQESLPEPTKPNSFEGSVFSIAGGQRLMSESMTAISQQNYDQAVTKLQDARQVFNQLSNFYQELNTIFAGIDNRVSDSHRSKALQTAQLRDDATYQLAIVYRAKNQPELAVPLLVQLIRSQAPTRDLGQQAYQQLYELGFVDAQYLRPSAATPK